MKLFPLRRLSVPVLAVGAVLAASIVGSSAASPITQPKTVTATVITATAGTRAPGTKVSSHRLGHRIFVDDKHGFALADTGGAQYSAATTDGGKTWRIDSPALHLNAAQAPLAVTDLGAASRKTIFAFASGQVIDTSSDGGKTWYRAFFVDGETMAVVAVADRLIAFVDISTSNTSSKGVTWQFVSTDGGRTWKYNNHVGGF
jgi:hypothetical protein